MNQEVREAGQESHEGQNQEKRAENEGQLIKGAEMLEEPVGSNFTQGLQTFIAWVKSLVAPND